MTDIVERLRIRANDKFIRDYPLMAEAADEIERLRHEEKQLITTIQIHTNEIERLRAALAKIVATVPGDWDEADDIARLALKGKAHE